MSNAWRRVLLAGALLFVSGLALGEDKEETTLQALRQGIVNINVSVNPQAHSAATLGERRTASGVVIDNDGLIVTVGYIILEATSVEIAGPDGAKVPGAVVGYHAETGFGLVRALRPIKGAQPIRLGNSGSVSVKDPVLIMAYNNSDGFASGMVVSRRTFTGYWEYILEDPLYTIPALPNYAGAALVDKDFSLVGVGSLLVNNAVDPEVNSPGNVFIPIDALKPLLPELTRTGLAPGPNRPWLGLNVVEQFGRVIVMRVTPDGPAHKAGLNSGDMIFEVAGKPVESVEDFFRAVWRQGQAGVVLPLKVLQRQSVRQLSVSSGDRYQFYRIHPLY